MAVEEEVAVGGGGLRGDVLEAEALAGAGEIRRVSGQARWLSQLPRTTRTGGPKVFSAARICGSRAIAEMPDFVGSGRGRGGAAGGGRGCRRERRCAPGCSPLAGIFLDDEGILDDVADALGRQDFARLVIHVPVLADDDDVELVHRTVSAGDRWAIVGHGEWNVGFDHARLVGKRGDEDDLLAGELLVDLPGDI